MEPRELAAALEAVKRAAAAAAGGGGGGGGSDDAAAAGASGSTPAASARVDALGADMAVITTFVRLLELQAARLEGADEGSGPLEDDLAALRGGGGDSELPSWRRACVVYRAGQKALVRAYLVRARRELQDTLGELQRAVAAEEEEAGK
jgi:hypothetical protein